MHTHLHAQHTHAHTHTHTHTRAHTHTHTHAQYVYKLHTIHIRSLYAVQQLVVEGITLLLSLIYHMEILHCGINKVFSDDDTLVNWAIIISVYSS